MFGALSCPELNRPTQISGFDNPSLQEVPYSQVTRSFVTNKVKSSRVPIVSLKL